eukprot:6204901-Pleurochrysis_carterae.AAC.1
MVRTTAVDRCRENEPTRAKVTDASSFIRHITILIVQAVEQTCTQGFRIRRVHNVTAQSAGVQ